MLSQITKDRLNFGARVLCAHVVIQTIGYVALSSIISALSKNALKIGSASFSIPVVSSLATRAFIIIGATFVIYRVTKFFCMWLIDNQKLAHFDLISWKWINIRSHFTKD